MKRFTAILLATTFCAPIIFEKNAVAWEGSCVGSRIPTANAKNDNSYSKLESIIHRYLHLVADGAHFTESGRNELAKLANTRAEGGESVFTTHVISGYRILGTTRKNVTTETTVEFENIGSMTNDFYSFRPHRVCENFVFVFNRSADGIWAMINGPAPAMYEKTVVNHLKRLEENARSTGGNPDHFRKLIMDVQATAKLPIQHR